MRYDAQDEYADIDGPYRLELIDDIPQPTLSTIFLAEARIRDKFIYVTGQFDGACFESMADSKEFGYCTSIVPHSLNKHD